MTSDFSEARQQRFRDDELFQDRATRGIHRRGMVTPSAQEGEVAAPVMIPPEFLEGLSEADAALTQTFYEALVAHHGSTDLLSEASGFTISEQLGNSARVLLETAHQQFDFWATRSAVENGEGVALSDDAAALQAMVDAVRHRREVDRQAIEDGEALPQRHFPRRAVTAAQAALFRIAAPPQPEYALENTEPDNGFTAEQQAEIKGMTAADDAARAAGEDIIDAHHRAGGIS